MFKLRFDSMERGIAYAMAQNLHAYISKEYAMTTREKIIAALQNMRDSDANLKMNTVFYSYDQGRYETYITVLAWLDEEIV
jgi:hypothetical protein